MKNHSPLMKLYIKGFTPLLK